MLFIFSTKLLIIHLWQPKIVVFLHWCLISTLLLENTIIYSYIKTSGGQSSNLSLNVVHFFNASVHLDFCGSLRQLFSCIGFKYVLIYSLNTSIYSYLETSGGRSSNLYLNVVHFFNNSVHLDFCGSLR